MSTPAVERTRANRKVVAVAAAAVVLLAGATVTSLAAWLDEEWVTAGVDGDAGVAASEFEIEQSVVTDGGSYFNRETAGIAGVVGFDEIAQSLSPGAVAYGWVSLRTAADSVGGVLELVPAYTAGDSALGDVLLYGARVHTTPATCNEAGFGAGTALVPDGTPLGVGSGTTTFDLASGGTSAGTAETVCFRLELPASAPETLMGETADVTWYFEASSD